MGSQNFDESYPLLASKSSMQEDSTAIVSATPAVEHASIMLSDRVHTKVYRKRWYMLAVFCFVAFCQGLLWNTWSPLGDAMYIAFGWTSDFIAFSLAMCSVGIVLCSFPIMYLIERKDLRVGTVLAVVFLLICVIIWNIAHVTHAKGVFALGCFFTGLSSSLALVGPTLLSVLWFPVAERTTATAFAAMSPHFGIGLGFIIGPIISGVKITAYELEHSANISDDRRLEIQNGLKHVVYFDTILAVLCFILVVAYFPARPLLPPSVVQTKPRTEYWLGLKQTSKNVQFWILNMAFNVANGTFNAWLPMLSVLLSTSLFLDETVGDWMGFVAMMSGCIGSVLIAMVIDRHKRLTKRALLIMSVSSVLLYALLGLIQWGYIRFSDEVALTAMLYILVIGISICMNGGVPLYFELGCEITYPVPEGLSAAYITVLNDVFGLIFYTIFFIPGLDDGDTWTTGACLIACILSFPMLLLLKEKFSRLDEEATAIEEKDVDS
ncbi:solute carrier family 49 member 4-like isoform X2 [Watersipora subatra]